VLLVLTIKKALVNDRLMREKKALMLQAEMEQISSTLFDRSALESQ
jgi:hypothetical protein